MSSQAVKTDQRKPFSGPQQDQGKNLPASAPRVQSQALVTRNAKTIEVAGQTAPVEDHTKKYAAIGAGVAAIALLSYALLLPSEGNLRLNPKMKQKETERIEQLVNKHLVMTNTNIEIQQKKKNLELKERLHSLGDTVHQRPLHAPPIGVDMSPDRNELNATNDLRGNSENLNYTTPGNEILKEIADQQQQRAAEAAYNKAYREAVIQEARSQGYELQFAPDGRILNAKPIRQDMAPGRGPSSH